MTPWRIAAVVGIAALPLAGLYSAGWYYLRESGWAMPLWWASVGCWAVASLLGWVWQRRGRLLRPVGFTPLRHWTDRDRQAWQLVEARANAVGSCRADQLADQDFYLATGADMLRELARFYHPDAQDPAGPLTVPEILTAIELASHDLLDLVERNLPAGRRLTIGDLRRAERVYDWYQAASKLRWVFLALVSPVQAVLLFAANWVGVSRPSQLFWQDLLAWFYRAYVHYLGSYLIELNSRRLRNGARRYRELCRQWGMEGRATPADAVQVCWWRAGIIAVPVALALLVPAGFGCVTLVQWGAWWAGLFAVGLVVCLGLAGFLFWHWTRRRPVPPDRDAEAWRLVKARAEAARRLPAERLADLMLYPDTAREMARELARHYHRNAPDPYSPLTIPEILRLTELVSHDLWDMMDQRVPGAHLLTVEQWRAAGRWATSPDGGLLSRVVRQIGARLLPWLQEHLLTRFWAAYVEYCGQHLIELYSGRLQPTPAPPAPPPLPDGETAPAVTAPPPPDAAAGICQVTVTLMGQVKAGKSSLVNALLGEQRARTDVLPATAGVDRYELQPPGIPTRLVLLDTVGYGHAGPKEDQLQVTQEAARQSDLLLLVMHARNPARQADQSLLQALQHWFASQPDLRMPPILGVLTHIDLLSPAMEWAPTYDWQQPRRPKEVQIAGAVEAAREQVGDYLATVVPVCTSPGKVYGIDQWLLPAVARLMDDAHAVAFLRCLRAEIDTDRARKVFHQLAEAGRLAVRWFREGVPADRLSEPGP